MCHDGQSQNHWQVILTLTCWTQPKAQYNAIYLQFPFVRNLVELGSDLSRNAAELLLNSSPEIITMPVRVNNDFVADRRSPPRLSAVDEGGDVDNLVHGDDESVLSPERAVEVVGEVLDVVHRRQENAADIIGCHVVPEGGEASGHLGAGEGWLCLQRKRIGSGCSLYILGVPPKAAERSISLLWYSKII